MKKKFGPMDPLGYLGSLSRVQIMECFQNSIGLAGLEVTPIPFSALADFGAIREASGVMWVESYTTKTKCFRMIFQ